MAKHRLVEVKLQSKYPFEVALSRDLIEELALTLTGAAPSQGVKDLVSDLYSRHKATKETYTRQ